MVFSYFYLPLLRADKGSVLFFVIRSGLTAGDYFLTAGFFFIEFIEFSKLSLLFCFRWPGLVEGDYFLTTGFFLREPAWACEPNDLLVSFVSFFLLHRYYKSLISLLRSAISF